MEVEAYLSFAGNCEEALKFYEKCLGGKVRDIWRYEGSPMDNAGLPADWKNKVMHATFEAGTTKFMAADMMPGHAGGPAGYAGFSMSVNVPKDTARAKKVFEALAEGGKVTMPLEKQFWGALFGMCTDRFGVPWMVNCDE